MLARGLAYASLALTFAMMLLGGAVHGTGSSLACPDWPTCYGEAFPRMEGGIFWEHSHRMLGTLIGVAIIALSFVLFLDRRRGDAEGRARQARHYAVAMGLIVVQGLLMGVAVSQLVVAPLVVAVVISVLLAPLFVRLWRASDNLPAFGLLLLEVVIIQGLLGGFTVVMRLPVWVSSAHLALSMIFLSMLVYLCLRLQPGAGLEGATLSGRRAVTFAIGLLFVQIVLGALVKHTGASLACHPDLLLCGGQVLPKGGPAHLHFTHRLLAFVVTGVVIAMTLPGLRAARQAGRGMARFFGIAAHALVALQVLLGFLTVLSYVTVSMAVLHLGTGALLLADLIAFHLSLGPLGARAAQAAAPAHGAELAGAPG